MCGPRQLFLQCGPELPKGWTPRQSFMKVSLIEAMWPTEALDCGTVGAEFYKGSEAGVLLSGSALNKSWKVLWREEMISN